VPNIQSDNKIEVQLLEEEGLNVLRSQGIGQSVCSIVPGYCADNDTT